MQPVIDIHTHLFNGRDIPLKGYLQSRKYDNSFQEWAGKVLIPTIAKCIRNELDGVTNIIRKIQCCLSMKAVYAFMGREYKFWAETLAKNVPDIADEMTETYLPDHIDLFIPLMIDYEYWFWSTQDNLLKDQINTMVQQIILPMGGRIHPFVPFDPCRELACQKGMNDPDGNPETAGSMKLVRDAIENKGFLGVKLYNALGYKPWNNRSVEENRKRIALHGREYVFPGDEYDRVLGDLYDYCIEQDIPVTTHCGMYGIESYPDASFDFGKAAYWRDVLSQQRFRNLRLNLAHFGWYTPEGYTGDITWVRDICEMLDEFENLYTDVSGHHVVIKKYFPGFITDYQRICHDFPVVKNRLLYGTDWHVCKRTANYRHFNEVYLKVLGKNNLFSEAELAGFLGGNALKFLGLLPGNQNRKRLKAFYTHHQIEPPDWFRETDHSS